MQFKLFAVKLTINTIMTACKVLSTFFTSVLQLKVFRFDLVSSGGFCGCKDFDCS